MERLLARLESRFGRHAPAGATWFLVIAQAVVFALASSRPAILALLMFDRDAVLHGQVWRLVSYLAIPPSLSPISLLLALYWLYLMGTSLEAQWGAFRYQVFWLVGIVATTALAFALGIPASNRYLLLSLGLAFATLFPDYEIRLFFVVPLKVKWLGLLDALVMGYEVATLDGWTRLLPIAALGTYLLFFLPTLLARTGGRVLVAQRAVEHTAFKRESDETAFGANGRRCSVCGVTDEDPSADFRVCTCEKCGGRATEFCLAHARSH